MYSFVRSMARLVLLTAAVGAVVVCGTILIAGGAPKPALVATNLLGQNEWQAGETAYVRITTTDVDTGKPVAGIFIRAELYRGKAPVFSKDRGLGVVPAPVLSISGKTDKQGTLSLAFRIKADMRGAYTLVVVSGSDESDRIEQPVKIVSRSRVMLTTDKPVYQPGQTIHIRALALRPTTMEPVADTKCTIEVDDSKGNKVFKQPTTSSKFGVFSAGFVLATEINQGTYTVRALLEDERTEKAVTVERYVLPKFKVQISTEKPFYLPKQTINGKVNADYFFGKSVSDATVTLKLSTFDVAFKDFAELSGKTNHEGVFEFEQPLPDYFVGLPLEQGNSLVKIEATIKDGAGHEEKSTITVPVADQPIRILAVPEGGVLRPGLENVIYIMASYPDGRPAIWSGSVYQPSTKPGEVSGTIGTPVKSDELGIAQTKVTPTENALALRVDVDTVLSRNVKGVRAIEMGGNGEIVAKADFSFKVEGSPDESVILRTDKAIAKSGDKVALTVLSTKKTGSAYIDLIASGRTTLTRTVDVKGGKASTTVTLPPDVAGTVEAHAYIITRNGDTVRDTRMIYVEPPSDLNIKISADSEQYRPGGPAKISFDVTDKRGRGVAAALGISVVDEAVFALQDMKPGLEKVYFLLEKEIATPRYEIHEITPQRIFLESKPLDVAKPAVMRDEAARFLFASALKEQSNSATPFTMHASNYVEKIQVRINEYSKRVVEDYKTIAEAVRTYYAQKPERASLREVGGIHHLAMIGMLKRSAIKDQWGHEYVFTPCGCGSYEHSLTLQSLGPDGKKDTDDDIAVSGSPQQKDAEPATYTRRWGGRNFAMGGFGGARRDVFFADGAELGIVKAMPMAVAAPARESKAVDALSVNGNFDLDNSIVTKSTTDGPVVRENVRVRQFFPETMYWNPAVITDNDGKAQLTFDMADSITTWRMTAMGSSAKGLLGSTTRGLKVFQDFFVDIDLPVSLTQNDQVSIPIAVYNYLPETQKVRIDLTEEPWFALDGPATQTLTIGANDVMAVHFTITAKQIGWHKLTVKAHGTKLSDAIQREIEITPDGKEFRECISDTLEKSVKKTVNIPEGAIADGSNIVVRIYPGVFSQVVEGLDKIFAMPGGCFEQTSSVTYPNVLVLDYLKSTKKITPEIQMKAEGFINQGWQRLVSFEVQGGGFSWFGQAPANKVLSAYGLMEFADMSKVYEIDERVIDRTAKWLISQQEKNGSWKPDESYLHAESWTNIQHNEILPTAYITWALASSGSKDDPAVGKAMQYLKENWNKAENAYTLAIIANAFAAADKSDPVALKVIEKLVDMKKDEGDMTYWEAGVKSFCFSEGKTADLETTGMAAIALMEYGRFPNVVKGALNYIVRGKDHNGTWYSTQATVNCLKALVKSLGKGSESFEGNVTVTVNGKQAGTFKITKDDSDVLRQADAKSLIKPGANTVEISFDGKGSPAYSISSVYYLPWSKIKPEPNEMISIKVDFDRTKLAENDIVTSSVSVKFNGTGTAGMVIIDLGTPPGFQVLTDDLDELVKNNVFQKYNMTARQAIIYIEELKAGEEVKFDYRMKARFPIKARAPKSSVYRYYNPEVRADSPPVEMVVTLTIVN